LDRINGFRRQFDVNDASIQHTFTEHERITGVQLFLICLLAPLIIILLVALVWKRSLWDWHSGWLGLILSLAVTSTATNIVSLSRPPLLDLVPALTAAYVNPVFADQDHSWSPSS
jgi:diacylglycerol diphosphate phosphatase/phosphatidate phosphatase